MRVLRAVAQRRTSAWPVRSPAPLRFAVHGQAVFLEVPREDGLDLLEWLGLGRGEFGAIETRALRPLCQRRLWPEPRNLRPFLMNRPGSARMRETATLREMAAAIVRELDASPDSLVHFG